MYRFEVKAEPNKTAKLEVIEEQQRVDELAITNSEDDAIRFFIRGSVVSPKVKKALQDALELKQQVTKAEHDIRQEEQALVVIEKDQSRIRANMERVPQTSAFDLLERYRKKLWDQENEIERRRQRITKLQQTVEEARQKYEAFLLGLNVE